MRQNPVPSAFHFGEAVGQAQRVLLAHVPEPVGMVMDHRTDGSTGSCVMAAYVNAGQIRRTFCADEKGLMVGFYGTR